ncbi:MAG TPA: nuclear transport factor 2 family protein [Thermoanaerobaculia bacterium]|nr:nuclear transport factor 2 family protein [Thermoanaerobaculia bacterium]
MKSLLHALLILTLATPLAAQEPDAAVHNALRQLKATMEKALNERDLDTIVANVDPNVVFTTMNGDVCRGPNEIRAYFDKMLRAPGHIVKDVKVSFEVDRLTTLYGGDTGIAVGSSKDHYELNDGQTFDIAGRWTCTMVRSGDRWVVSAFHYSADIFRNPIVDRYKKAITQAGAAAGMAALVIGLVVGWFLARRRTAG